MDYFGCVMRTRRFVNTRFKRPARKVTLMRKDGFLVATSGKRITMAETRKLMDQFP
jgi:hypothetical protein